MLLCLNLARSVPCGHMVMDQFRVYRITVHFARLAGPAHAGVDGFGVVGELEDLLGAAACDGVAR